MQTKNTVKFYPNMKEIIFNTKYNNKYLYLDGNIVFLHNNFFNSIDGSTDKLDNYYTRKFIFLKEKLSKESKNITYTTNITPQIIKENIANLKQLLIEVTDGCNLACEYCGYGKLYGNYDKRNGKMQSFQQVRILLDFLINEWNSQYNNSYKNNIYIGFYGGEPLLNFKLIHEVIEYLDSKCMNNIIFQYNMTTNAMLLDRYMDYLKEKQVHLLISIDGNKENHSYRITKTGKNSFDTVYSNILKLKNKYHDILGQNLSILQQYLNKENITQENFEEIKFMIQKMFIDIEDTDDTNANLENLIKIHKKNGTDIIIDGKLPQNKETAKVFFEIIREATTNAIRHAGSSKVFVNIKETLEETYMIITNDGRKPNEFITENQGIKDMRRKVKKLGGMFYISTVPEFSVNISIKNNC